MPASMELKRLGSDATNRAMAGAGAVQPLKGRPKPPPLTRVPDGTVPHIGLREPCGVDECPFPLAVVFRPSNRPPPLPPLQ